MLYDVAEYEKQAAKIRRKVRKEERGLTAGEYLYGFKTDLRYVLEFLRNAKDKKKLKELMENEPYYKSMDEDAYDVVVNYANVKKLVEVKDEYKDIEGRMNMRTAIKEMTEDSKSEGRMEGIRVMIKTARKYHASDDEILEQLMTEMSIDEDEARKYLKQAE